MLIVEYLVTDVLQLPPIILFGAICGVSLVLGFRVFSSIGATPRLAGTPTSGTMAHRAATG
jgi:hypothetical protein